MFYTPSPSDYSITPEDPDSETEYGLPSSMSEPEPHAALSISDAVHSAQYRPTKTRPPSRPPQQDYTGFSEVISLFHWLDQAMILPEWTLPEGASWDAATLEWLDNEWWGMHGQERHLDTEHLRGFP